MVLSFDNIRTFGDVGRLLFELKHISNFDKQYYNFLFKFNKPVNCQGHVISVMSSWKFELFEVLDTQKGT